jgi:hypothetical protein
MAENEGEWLSGAEFNREHKVSPRNASPPGRVRPRTRPICQPNARARALPLGDRSLQAGDAAAPQKHPWPLAGIIRLPGSHLDDLAAPFGVRHPFENPPGTLRDSSSEMHEPGRFAAPSINGMIPG